MHKLIYILKERIIVVSIIILAVSLATITSVTSINEISFNTNSNNDVNNFHYSEASFSFFNLNKNFDICIPENETKNNFEKLTINNQENNDKNFKTLSYNLWDLTHFWSYINLISFISNENWINSYLFYNCRAPQRQPNSANIVPPIFVEEKNTISNEKINTPSLGGSNQNSAVSRSNSGNSQPTSDEEIIHETPPPSEEQDEEEHTTGDIYYVAKNGKNTNDGSESSPWRTIQKAAETIKSGDTVYIKEGYYNECIWPENSGESGRLITYTSYEDDAVVIDGSNIPIEWGGLMHIYDQHHIRISGLRFRDSSCFGVYITGEKSNNIVIDNCDFTNIESSAIQVLGRYWLREIHDIDINNNSATNICFNSKQEAISLSGINIFAIHNNYVSDCPKYAIDVKDGCANGLIYKNKIDTSKGNGIYCDAFDMDNYNIKIYENAIWGENTAIALGTEHGGTLRNIQLYDNIIFTTGNGFQINNHCSYEGSHKKTNIIVRNNTFYDNSICILITDKRENFDGFAIRNNIFNKYEEDMYFVSLKDSDVIIYNNFFNKKININFDLLKV